MRCNRTLCVIWLKSWTEVGPRLDRVGRKDSARARACGVHGRIRRHHVLRRVTCESNEPKNARIGPRNALEVHVFSPPLVQLAIRENPLSLIEKSGLVAKNSSAPAPATRRGRAPMHAPTAAPRAAGGRPWRSDVRTRPMGGIRTHPCPRAGVVLPRTACAMCHPAHGRAAHVGPVLNGHTRGEDAPQRRADGCISPG